MALKCEGGLFPRVILHAEKNSRSFARCFSSSLLTTQIFVVHRNCCYRPMIRSARSTYEQKTRNCFVQRSFKMFPLDFSQVFIRKWWELDVKLQASPNAAENSILIGVPTLAFSCPTTAVHLSIFMH